MGVIVRNGTLQQSISSLGKFLARTRFCCSVVCLVPGNVARLQYAAMCWQLCSCQHSVDWAYGQHSDVCSEHELKSRQCVVTWRCACKLPQAGHLFMPMLKYSSVSHCRQRLVVWPVQVLAGCMICQLLLCCPIPRFQWMQQLLCNQLFMQQHAVCCGKSTFLQAVMMKGQRLVCCSLTASLLCSLIVL